MPNYCVVFPCMNTPSNIISLHQIPKDKHLFKLWKDFVSVKRANWIASPKSTICSAHFRKDSFENSRMVDMGNINLKRMQFQLYIIQEMRKKKTSHHQLQKGM